jgi:excinuclease ABC subunit B
LDFFGAASSCAARPRAGAAREEDARCDVAARAGADARAAGAEGRAAGFAPPRAAAAAGAPYGTETPQAVQGNAPGGAPSGMRNFFAQPGQATISSAIETTSKRAIQGPGVSGRIRARATSFRIDAISQPLLRLESDFRPAGDQPAAIEAIVRGFREGRDAQTLLGVTGSGKTFTVAHVANALQRPMLVLAPNKTLAAQLYSEFHELFPENAVQYFISYYDYYQPEAYIPSTDTYIEKDSSINDRIDRMRHAATRNVLARRDSIVVASVSCIYGLGSPSSYGKMAVQLRKGSRFPRDEFLRELTILQYRRNDFDLVRGHFRVRGDVVDVFPIYEDSKSLRIELFGDEIDRLTEIDPLTGEVLREMDEASIYPGSHYVQPKDRILEACDAIELELEERLTWFRDRAKLLEAERLEQRTRFDLEMMREVGFCHGIENYSRHLDGRSAGQPPFTLLDYFPKDFLLVVDESHVALPQVGGMYLGDRSRKETLVEYGFRLPSALDNRPLTFAEFEARIGQRLYVSATPAQMEIDRSGGIVVEQIVRPTGLVDPQIEVRPARRQVDDLMHEVKTVVAKGFRVLATTLTKRMAEELTEYLGDAGVRVRYLHSDIDSLKRNEILRDLRLGVFDVLVGINLLREGLDLPEVALVAVLDADREGFLRSETSLIQTFGRAARNVEGRVILYADKTTDSMKRAMDVTNARRAKQVAFNLAHGITPKTIIKPVRDLMTVPDDEDDADAPPPSLADLVARGVSTPRSREEIEKRIVKLKDEMLAAAKDLEFERAAEIRDEILRLEAASLEG